MDSQPEKKQSQGIEIECEHSKNSDQGEGGNPSGNQQNIQQGVFNSNNNLEEPHERKIDNIEVKIEEVEQQEKKECIQQEIQRDLRNIQNTEKIHLDLNLTKIIWESRLLTETNYKEIINYNLKIEDNSKAFLRRHQLPRWLWSKTIEYISEVLCETEANFSTFFYAVAYFNKYLSNTLKSVRDDQAQKLAVQCMYLASQYNDVTRGVPNAILAHAFCAVTLKELQEFSTMFLENIGFRLSFPHSFVFLTLALNGISEIEGISEVYLVVLIDQAYFLLRLVQTRYAIMSQYKSSRIAGGVLAYVVYLLSKKQPTFPKFKCYKILEKLLKFRTPEVYSETYSYMIMETLEDLEQHNSTILKSFPEQLDQFKILKSLGQ